MLSSRMAQIALVMIISFISLSANAYADVVVIVHKENAANISMYDVELLYLGKSETFPDGRLASPLNLDSENVKESFNQTVLKRSSSQLSSHWSRLIFTGKAIPPETIESETDVIAAVKNNRSAIGYISEKTAESLKGDVRIIRFN